MAEQKAALGIQIRSNNKEIALMPTADELRVLSLVERSGFRLVRKMNSGRWKRFWTWCQRHIGSLWIHLATYNLMNVHGLENFEKTNPARPVIIAANHRSFFDMYTVSSVLFRRTKRPITLYFPVRARFFYDSPLGWLVNLIMGWWAMYPPFFREARVAQKREFDRFSVRELIRLCSAGHGHVIGFHPEGKRQLSPDPYRFLPAQPGIGNVVSKSNAQVVPVFIAGLGNNLMRQVLGNWTGGEKIRIWFGEPIDPGEFSGKRDSLRTHKEIADLLMTKIADLGRRDEEWARQPWGLAANGEENGA